MNNRALLGLTVALLIPALSCNAQTYTILHTFKDGKDGSSPLPGSGAGYVADANGNLYGAAAFGGNAALCGGNGCGVLFELTPPANGQKAWSESTLYRFKGGTDGAFPAALTATTS